MEAILAKFEDKEKYPRMYGTEGKMDYIVVACDEETGMQLGIKPLFGLVDKDGPKIMAAFRMRSAAQTNVSAFGEASAKKTVSPNKAFDFPWEKADYKRASLIRTIILDRTPDEANRALGDLKAIRYASKIRELIQAVVPLDKWIVSAEDFDEFVYGTAEAFFAQVAAHSDPAARLVVLKQQKEAAEKAFAEQMKAYEDDIAAAEAAVAEQAGAQDPDYVPPAKPALVEELTTLSQASAAHAQLAPLKLKVVAGTDVAPMGDDEGSDDFGGDEGEDY